MTRSAWVAALGATLAIGLAGVAACSKKSPTPTAPATQPLPAVRCSADLSAFLDAPGSGATAHLITQTSDLLQGSAAQSRLGDYLLANDQIRVIVQQPNRIIGPDPYGGAIIDADTVHGGPGNDQFGKLAFFYNFGRTVNARTVEVINSGSEGGPAILAATGEDEVDDYINIKNVLSEYLPAGTTMVLDPDVVSHFLITTYYVLAPGQRHVSVLTAVCNPGSSDQLITAGDLIDSGGDVAFFSPEGQTGGLGYTTNPDAVPWMGWMASDNTIAYGVAPWKLNDPNTPETNSNCLTTAGVTGYIIGNNPGLDGLVEWTDPNNRNRSGSLLVPAAGNVVVAREFAVGNDLGDVATTLETARAAKTGVAMVPISGTVSDSLGLVPGARVVAERPNPSPYGGATMREAVFVTNASGQFSGSLPADAYTLTAWQLGRLPGSPVTLTLAAGSPASPQLFVGDQHSLTVNIADASGNPLPGKVTVECASGPCPVTPMNLVRWEDSYQDPRPDNLQLVGFVTPSGTATFNLPPGQYTVFVSHGPEWTLYPMTSPGTGASVDLTTNATATLNAQLTRVIDTPGWMSADFHVHSINSPDSTTTVFDRNRTFLAEGVDVLSSSDHDYVTDYGPTNASLGGQGRMATMVGLEISTFDYGHYNPWPITLDPTDTVTYGAIDWAGGSLDAGDLPCLSIDQIIDAARTVRGATTFQINHANGNMSTFGSLGLDADTLATTQPASKFRLAPVAGATAGNSGLMPTEKWDAMEIMNGFSSPSYIGLLNNWMTFLGNGLVVTGSAVSDTHKRWSSAAGYPRSYVRMANDDVSSFDPAAMSAAVNAGHLVGSLGLFVRAYAFVGGTAPDLTQGLVDLDSACAAAPDGGCVQVGDLLAPGAAGGIDFVVDVESPSWIPFDTIQLLDHASAHPMENGVANTTLGSGTSGQGGYWSQSVALSATDLEAVTLDLAASFACGSSSGCTASRYHVQRVFHLLASDVPTDDFLFAVVSESSSANNLMPLVYDGVLTSNGTTTAVPATAFAFTNAIFIDRDGGGYNHPPGVHQANRHPRPPARHFSSVKDGLRQLLLDAEAEK